MTRHLFASLDLERFMPLEEMGISPLSASLHYGHAVFEGMSMIKNGDRLSVFHPWLNLERLRESASAVGMEAEFTDDAVVENVFRLAAMCGLHRKNARMPRIKRAGKFVGRFYVRPLLFSESTSLVRTAASRTRLATMLQPMGEYVGDGAGIDVMVYPDPRVFPFPGARVSSNYQFSIQAKKRLTFFNILNGSECSEVLFTNGRGSLVEGGGESIILVRDNEFITPPPSEGVVPGISLRFISLAARAHGFGFRFGTFTPNDLAGADEVLLSGNASGLVPVRRVHEADAGFRSKRVHEISSRPGRTIRPVKEEYERMEIGEGPHSTFHAVMDDWVDGDEREVLYLRASDLLRKKKRNTLIIPPKVGEAAAASGLCGKLSTSRLRSECFFSEMAGD
jgi:branched-subunit amino acid aminotransferase/4-amino-4-deoxychorismate lyase